MCRHLIRCLSLLFSGLGVRLLAGSIYRLFFVRSAIFLFNSRNANLQIMRLLNGGGEKWSENLVNCFLCDIFVVAKQKKT